VRTRSAVDNRIGTRFHAPRFGILSKHLGAQATGRSGAALCRPSGRQPVWVVGFAFWKLSVATHFARCV
jgi:hypothetical protein